MIVHAGCMDMLLYQLTYLINAFTKNGWRKLVRDGFRQALYDKLLQVMRTLFMNGGSSRVGGRGSVLLDQLLCIEDA